MTIRSSFAAGAGALALAALLGACATKPLNPFGRPYDEENVLKPGAIGGCKGPHDVAPYLEFGSDTLYPATHLMNGNAANVVVLFKVDEQGRVEPMTVAEGPSRTFITHVHVAMQDWRVRPATLRGQPVAVICTRRQGYRLIGPWAPVPEDGDRN